MPWPTEAILGDRARECGQNGSEKWWHSWAGNEGGLDLEGKNTPSPCWSMFPSMEGVGAAISSPSGLILVEGSVLYAAWWAMVLAWRL